jgi:hypothetical protein
LLGSTLSRSSHERIRFDPQILRFPQDPVIGLPFCYPLRKTNERTPCATINAPRGHDGEVPPLGLSHLAID